MSQHTLDSTALPRRFQDPGELLARVHTKLPELRFAPEHLIRRAVRERLKLSGLRAFMPHMQGLALPTEQLAQVLDEQERLELGQLPTTAWTYLLPQPDKRELTRTPAEQVLNTLWRTLFHLKCDQTLYLLAEARDERLTDSALLSRFDRLGQLPADEVREVLAEEGLRVPEAGDLDTWVELVSTWHELRFFAPRELKRWFPSLVDRPHVEPLLHELLDAEALLEATRPLGASDKTRLSASEVKLLEADSPVTEGAAKSIPRMAAFELKSSKRALESGLALSAAVLAARARQYGSHEEGLTQQTLALKVAGEHLAQLYAHPELSTRADEWALALEPLLARAELGMVRVEARLLHDLQTACQDHTEERRDLNLGRFLRSFGRRPLRRLEPIRAEVGVVRNLRRAQQRLSACRLSDVERRRLARLLGDLAAFAEAELRAKLSPMLAESLLEAGLVPQNLPERVAQESIVSELLDLLLKRGFLVFSDLRDLIARSQLKLPDLTGVMEWLKGDQLLKLNRLLAERLDGAYRKAEFYLNGLQRLTSVFYGTALGRLLVRFLILPFGGAFFLVQGLEHMLGPLIKLFAPKVPPLFPGVEAPHLFWSLQSFLATTALLYLLLHSSHARQAAMKGVRLVGRGLHRVFVAWPRQIRQWRPIAWLIETKAFLLLWRGLLLPAIWVALPTFIASLFIDPPHLAWLYGALPVGLGLGAWFLSRSGERLLERMGASLVGSYGYVKNQLIPNVISGTLAFFKRVLEIGEISLYRVDEWLRIRRGESMLSMGFKLIFGFIWSIFAYMARLLINLVVEPQVNPIKHFPVVTVSHKVTIPTTLVIAQELRPYLGPAAANVIGGVAQFIIPGICGFLVWEFKENWRLYASNRKPELNPVLVGSHGETLPRLLRLGFHSGTIPRLFRDLRKAGKRANGQLARQTLESLHHIEESVLRFVLRELKTLLLLDGRFPHADAIQVDEIKLTPARIALTLSCPPLGEPLKLHFEEQSGFLVVAEAKRGFVDQLTEEARTLFEGALRGFYKLAGVDVLRPQVEALLPMEQVRYDISRRGLLVWPRSFKGEWRYALRERQNSITPEELVASSTPLHLPTLQREALFFQAQPLLWKDWRQSWNFPPSPAHEARLKELQLQRTLNSH